MLETVMKHGIGVVLRYYFTSLNNAALFERMVFGDLRGCPEHLFWAVQEFDLQ